MKKPIIALAALTVAAAASIGAFLAVKNKDDKNKQQEADTNADKILFSLDAELINSVTLDGKEGVFSVEKQAGLWQLTSAPADFFPVNQTNIQQLCTSFSYLTASNSYGEITDEKLTMYGLDDPFTLTVTDSEPHVLHIGAESPTKDYYYATVDGKSNIYAITSGVAEEFMLTENKLRSTDLISYGDKDIVEIRLEKDGKSVYDLIYDNDERKWKLPDEYSALILDQTAVTSMINYLTRLNVYSLLENHLDDLSVYGFDKPDAEMVFKGSDGSEEKIIFGSKHTDPDTTPILMTNTNQAAYMYTGDIYFKDYTLLDFIANVVEGANMYSITGFDIKAPGCEDSFTINMKEGTGECRGTKLDFTNAVLSSLFDSFYNTFSYISVSKIDTEAKPVLKDPLLSAVYHYDGDQDATLDLVDAGGGRSYIFVDGKYIGLICDNTMLSGSKSVSAAYEAMCGQAGLEPSAGTDSDEADKSGAETEDAEKTDDPASEETAESEDDSSEKTVEKNPLAD